MKKRLGKKSKDAGFTRLPHKLTGPVIRLRPTGYGMIFLAVLAVMLVGSIRYNNNLGFLLFFLLGCMAVVSVRHTRRNLYGIQIVSCKALPVFAGDSAEFELVAESGSMQRNALAFAFDRTESRRLDLNSGKPVGLVLRTPPLERGLFAPGPLKISSRYPIGLFVARAILWPDVAGLVYPRPLSGSFIVGHQGGGSREPGTGREGIGADDFKGLRAYEPGDSLQHLSWKVFSRGLGLHTKEFVSAAGAAVCLDWFRLSGMAVEKRLERLCGMVLEAQRRHLPFGLKLPGKAISAGIGAAHGRRCLAELALYGGDDPPRPVETTPAQSDFYRYNYRVTDGHRYR